MPTIRLQDVKSSLQLRGVTISKRDREYRVNLAGGAEATAYYTDDLDDAYHTGVKMAVTA